MADSTGVTAASQEYLEWIYRLSKEKELVHPLDLARVLKVSSASVTAMLKRLTAGFLVEYRTHEGITLTPQGQQVAAGIVRRHELLERLATDVLGIPWEKADEVACQLEHYVSEEVEARLSTFLGNPTTCPHGQLLDLESPDHTRSLCDVSPGETVAVVRITDERRDLLSYLAELGVRPGTCIRVSGLAPFNGPLMITVGDATHAIGREVAMKIRVGSPS